MNTKKNSMFTSILLQKCPQCHAGKMFKSNSYSVEFTKMESKCSCCGLDFIREPSFYFGAMYFSYTIQVAILVGVYLFFRLTTNPEEWTYIIWSIGLTILLLPWNYRISRVLWIYLFVPYLPS